MNEKQLEVILNDQLEDQTFEEFLEYFDLTPLDVLLVLYDEGFISAPILKRLQAVDT